MAIRSYPEPTHPSSFALKSCDYCIIAPEAATRWFHPVTPGSSCQIFHPRSTGSVFFSPSGRFGSRVLLVPSSCPQPPHTSRVEGILVGKLMSSPCSKSHVVMLMFFVKADEYCEEFYSVHVCLCIGTSV